VLHYSTAKNASAISSNTTSIRTKVSHVGGKNLLGNNIRFPFYAQRGTLRLEKGRGEQYGAASDPKIDAYYSSSPRRLTQRFEEMRCIKGIRIKRFYSF
jgi:hypothetical protein